MRLACWIRRHAETGSISTTFAADGSRVERKFAIAGRNRQTRETRALPRPNRNPAIKRVFESQRRDRIYLTRHVIFFNFCLDRNNRCTGKLFLPLLKNSSFIGAKWGRAGGSIAPSPKFMPSFFFLHAHCRQRRLPPPSQSPAPTSAIVFMNCKAGGSFALFMSSATGAIIS